MARQISDGEMEILAELQEWDGEPDGPDEEARFSGNWCPTCDDFAERCRCAVGRLVTLRRMFADGGAHIPWGALRDERGEEGAAAFVEAQRRELARLEAARLPLAS